MNGNLSGPARWTISDCGGFHAPKNCHTQFRTSKTSLECRSTVMATVRQSAAVLTAPTTFFLQFRLRQHLVRPPVPWWLVTFGQINDGNGHRRFLISITGICRQFYPLPGLLFQHWDDTLLEITSTATALAIALTCTRSCIQIYDSVGTQLDCTLDQFKFHDI